jgi:methionine-rich copper-binding protein CopC
MSRSFGLPLFALLLALALPSWPAGAHANLGTADPTKDERLSRPPSLITLRFTQALKPEGSWVQVKGSDGANRVREIHFDPLDTKSMQGLLLQLSPGVYNVTWQSLSAEDDDYADGTYSFVVLSPDGSTPGETGNSPAQQPSEDDDSDLSMTTALAVVAVSVVVLGALVFAFRYRRSPR